MRVTTYGPGGYQPTGPNSNIVNEVDLVDEPRFINEADLRAKALAALAVNNTYLAIATPTNAQVAAQVRVLTKECAGLIMLVLGRLDDVTGT